MIAAKEDRYLSPSFRVDTASRAVVRLKGAGLVHHPTLHLHALAAEAPPMDDDPDTGPDIGPDAVHARPARMRDLPEDAEPDELLAALAAALDRPPTGPTRPAGPPSLRPRRAATCAPFSPMRPAAPPGRPARWPRPKPPSRPLKRPFKSTTTPGAPRARHLSRRARASPWRVTQRPAPPITSPPGPDRPGQPADRQPLPVSKRRYGAHGEGLETTAGSAPAGTP